MVLAIAPEKRSNSADPLVRRYTCDSSPGKGAATGENADAARVGCFTASTAPRSNGRVPGDGEQGGGFQSWKAGDECYTAGKGQQDQIVPVNHGRLW